MITRFVTAVQLLLLKKNIITTVNQKYLNKKCKLILEYRKKKKKNVIDLKYL